MWKLTVCAVCLLGQSMKAAADVDWGTPPARLRNNEWRDVFKGPFKSPQVFAMPTANVVGSYQLSLRGDASLLTAPSALTLLGVVALGFGDVAQLEYRQTEAITSGPGGSLDSFVIPTFGVQLQVPYRHRYVPDLGVALRVGLPRDLTSPAAATQRAKATDLYFVASQSFAKLRAHVGIRASFATIETAATPVDRTLLLPTAALEWQTNPNASLAIEAAMTPEFLPQGNSSTAELRSGLLLRGGARWRVLPWLSLDASFGYRIEVANPQSPGNSEITALTDWDIRLGGEILIPWGAIACKTTSVFCN